MIRLAIRGWLSFRLVRPHLLSIDYDTPARASKSGTTGPITENAAKTQVPAGKIAGFYLYHPFV
jgi:hypothetical protein